MKVTSYIHPTRTYLPCTGVGRHINQILLGLAAHQQIHQIELLLSQQWLGRDGKLDPRSPLRDLPIRTFPTPENSTERTWKLFGYPKMDRYIPDDFDWVYAPAETYLPITKCPVGVTIHDIQAFETDLPWSRTAANRWFRYKWGRWVRRSLNDCRLIFTVSEFSKQRMVDLLGANPKKLVVVGNGVDQAFFDMAPIEPSNLDRPVESPYILVIGGLRYKKGGDHILDVARSLYQRKSDLQMIVAGEQEADYTEAAQASPNITLLGMVPDEELPRLVRSASSLLFLSLYEGFGIPALEAMAAGVPAVVANRASLPEVVGDAGIVVEPDNPNEIVDILINLESDPYLRQDYIQRGLQHASQYTWTNCVERLITALKEFS